MEKLLIDGKKILSGSINVSGSKNSTLPILAATILNNQTTIFFMLPAIYIHVFLIAFSIVLFYVIL